MENKVYWAEKPIDEIGYEILARCEDYAEHLKTSGRYYLWKRSYQAYYKQLQSGGKLNRTGEQGEFTAINVNHYRNLLLHLKTMITQSRPAMEPRATNSDYKSQAQTILAGGLLEYYQREKRLERTLKQAVELALVFGEGFISTTWDTTLGEVFDVDENGQEIRDGDIKYRLHSPLDVARDYTKETSQDHDWVIVREFRNRYALAKQHPDLADKILAIPSKVEEDRTMKMRFFLADDTDDVAVYILYHKQNPVLPEGRMVECLDPDCVIFDGPIPYRSIPVKRIGAEEQVGSPFGYSIGFDLLPIQEAIDALYSTVVTNQSTFGVQNILVPKGSGVSVDQIAGGLNIMEYDSKMGIPQPLNLTNTPPEVFNFIGQLENLQQTISGVNSVARGNPEANLKSGAALALVQSMAIQFSQSLQQSYVELLEDVGTDTINLLRDFAKTPRIAMIAGKSNRPIMKEFTGDDLDQINRVTVDIGNPLSKTTAGRVNLAETLIQNGMVENADQYLQVISTGRLDPVIEGKQAEMLNIRAENEALAAGQEAIAVVTDNHAMHILEHKVVLASPEARRNPQLVEAVTAHLMEHITFLKTTDPVLLQLMGQQPQAQMQQAPAMGASPAPMMDATNPVTQEAAQVNMPNMPQSPI